MSPHTEPQPAGPELWHSPRSAAVLLSEAIDRIDLIEPPGAREPIRSMFRAAIEMCAVSHSLLGQPMVYVLQLAQSLVDEDRQPEVSG